MVGVAATGDVIGKRFTLRRRIGSGGMGEVWAAVDDKGGHCAVKIIRTDLHDLSLISRFHRETALTAALQHENIVRVIAHGDGDADGGLFVAMELLPGVSLKSRLEIGHPLPWREACEMARDVARGLAQAHRQGIVHRDIKPANIMLVDDGTRARAVLLDFGVARSVDSNATMTGSGEVIGTAGYIAPEIALGGQSFDARADVYSLGVAFYEALVGAPPFVAANALALTMRHVNEDPRPPSLREPGVPPVVDAVVARMMARDPNARLQTADEAVAALQAVIDGAVSAGSDEEEAAAAGVAVWRSDFFVVSHDPLARLVRAERTERELGAAEEIGQVFSLLRSVFPPEARPGLSLLIDVRRGPIRSDPRFQKIVIAEIGEVYQGWRRVALLVATERGLEQGLEMRDRAAVDGRVFFDEQAAMSWLLS